MCLLMSIHGPKAVSKALELFPNDQPQLDVPTYYVASGFDHPPWPIIVGGPSPSLALFSWGLIPDWVKTAEEALKIRNQTLNARGETISTKPAFRQAAQTGRCVILLDGFFEYHKRDGKSYPFYIHSQEHEVFLVAGLRAQWTNPKNGDAVFTFSLVTTEANPMLAVIHNDKKRMPAILTVQESRRWLDPTLQTEEFQELLRPHEVPTFTAHSVSRAVGSHSRERNISVVQDRFDYPELGDIFSPHRQEELWSNR